MRKYLHFLYIIPIIFIIYYIYVHVLQSLIYKITHQIKVKDIWSYMYIYREIFVEKDYDPLLPKAGDVIFDVGGNQGLYSLYLNDKYKDITVHVFEPIYDLFQQLRGNVIRNVKPSNQILMNNIGLSEREEELSINYFPNGAGLSTLEDDIEEKHEKIIESKCKRSWVPGLCRLFMKHIFVPSVSKNMMKQTVKLVPMSKYIDENNINKIDIVKIDVEGHELQVLKGIRREHFAIIKSFIVEVENYRPGYLKEILHILHSNGYKTRIIDGEKQWCMVVANSS